MAIDSLVNFFQKCIERNISLIKNKINHGINAMNRFSGTYLNFNVFRCKICNFVLNCIQKKHVSKNEFIISNK